ncbi:hypothetical protein [Cryptosporangium sp. NPDC048952]|uniref:hypothetical protein n=1 Tax=Cryptosporangium sp. NPDC048952 TaxID=3363961 RepID=UPI003710189A
MENHFLLGQLAEDGDRVGCHLCGRWFLSVASHLRVHGWTKAAYIEAFGLELSNPLTGAATRKRRSAALTARQAVEPALLRSQSRARDRARSGALAAAAGAAARGRPHPPERRAKTLRTLAAIDPRARAEGSRRSSARRLTLVAESVAARFGFADFDAYLRDRLASGASLAAISREAGTHKDWLSRHLPRLAPDLTATLRPPAPRGSAPGGGVSGSDGGGCAAVAGASAAPDMGGGDVRGRLRVAGFAPHPGDARLGPLAARWGFMGVEAYLRRRHVEEHRSVASIAGEAGVSRAVISAALARHGIPVVPHATKRHQAAARANAAAQALGYDSLTEYVTDRRARGATWALLATESGIAETTLRRQGSAAT